MRGLLDRPATVYRFGMPNPAASDAVVQLDGVVKHFGDQLVLDQVGLTVRPGMVLALLGPSGCGKTTLLRTIAGETPPLTGRVEGGDGVQMAFFRQATEDLDPDDEVLMSFLEARNRPIGEARDLLARFLFRGEEVFKRVGDLSGGERSRLALARIFACGANFLMLDEPTNHLDLPSREALESVLPEFPGAILFVSHDRRFIDAVATHVWAVEDGRLSVVDRRIQAWDWNTYGSGQRATGNGQREAGIAPAHETPGAVTPAGGDGRGNGRRPASAATAPRPAESRAARAEDRRAAARVRELERAVSDAETALAALQSDLDAATAAQDVSRIAALGQALVEAEARLSTLIAAWEEAAMAAGV